MPMGALLVLGPSARLRGLSFGLAALVVLAGCASKITRSLVPATEAQTLDARSPYLKAHLSNGHVVLLEGWQVDSTGTAIAGRGTLFDENRVEISSGHVRLATDSVVLFETNVEEPSGASTAITVMVGITAAVAGMCLADPKTCFGSCPTFYAPGRDGEMELQAEGFSSSIAPALEATDVDMLLHARPTEREFTIRLTNEALETHVIRHADVLAAPRPPGGRVYVTSDGRFLEAFEAAGPTRCSSPGGDCLAGVLEADGDEWFSLADSTDLAAREILEVEFENVPDGPLGLVVSSRQTFITTFLIYQALAYLGEDAGRFLAMLDVGGDDVRRRAGGVGRALGDIEVLVQSDSGTWEVAGTSGETGPIAADTRVVPLATDGLSAGRIRLRLTQGLWRLDRVALVRLGAEVKPERLRPSRVRSHDGDHPGALDALHDPQETLVTLPGDSYDVSYQLPPEPQGYELFLEARGYYLEWMRQEWMDDRDPLRAAQLLTDPAGALRSLAPQFKAREPLFEELFWSSRYVR